MLASRNGHIEALALLLANGANVNAAERVIQN
jgi:ankyrin repeat protein